MVSPGCSAVLLLLNKAMAISYDLLSKVKTELHALTGNHEYGSDRRPQIIMPSNAIDHFF